MSLAILFALIGLALLLTDAEPRIKRPPAPDAEQVSAARAAVNQLRESRGKPAHPVRFDAAQLSAISVLASEGFRPNRFLVEVHGQTVKVTGSRKLPFGRWLNFEFVSRGKSIGFPKAYLTAGSLSLSQEASRRTLEIARRVANLRGAAIPPLDNLIKRFEIGDGAVSAIIAMPGTSGLLSQLGAADAAAEASRVARAYCRLTKLQKIDPSTDFAFHMRRAFPVDAISAASVDSNRAALIALAMLIVDPEVGELAGLSSQDVAPCRIEPVNALLHGRADLSKHWSLSAAIAVSAGTQFSQSIGEWKELADSISKMSELEAGDPSGFSFLDLAADRSGLLTAKGATAEATAASAAKRLSEVQGDGLLSLSLMNLGDGITNAAFLKAYGTTEDPRFLEVTRKIDAEIQRSVRRGPG